MRCDRHAAGLRGPGGRGAAGVELQQPPLTLPYFPLSMIWHDRHDYDPGHRWFRDLVGEIVTAI
jgi:hypothetical protein